MKKLLTILMLLVMTCALAAGASAASSSGTFRYEIRSGQATITGYEQKRHVNADELIVPSLLGNARVTAISLNAFSEGSITKTIILPDTLRTIEDGAFRECRFLQTIVVSPDHPVLATIDGVLFDKPAKKLLCYPHGYSQSSYAVPEGIAMIGNWAFYECSELTTVTLPDSLTSIGERAFRGCSNLTGIGIPNHVTTIAEGTFSGCTSLASVTLPVGITRIDNWAFRDCSALTAIVLPDTVTTIGKSTLKGCRLLKSITLPASVTEIGEDAFDECPYLTVTVERGSFAAQWCKDNNVRHIYPDSNDWLLK
ncbi:MAG: leucine-rich repeat domain-containing protein [Clostridia bacterium]|nr:leucine-rich repeat domain-containing protein [Clostridia bacterium]